MNEIELIKQKLDIVEFIGNYLELKKAGSNYKALCPFHEEKTPSFMVSPEKQIFKCFGCGESGSIFDFLMKYENLEFSEALKILAEKAGVKLSSARRQSPNQTVGQKTRLYRLNRLVSQVFHKILLQSPAARPARAYLKKRKLSNQTIQLFRIGYAPARRGWLDKFLRSRGFSQSDIQLAGSPGRFFNRIIFPLQDQLGNFIGFTGRTLDDQIQPKYLNTPETPVFHKSHLLYGYPQARQSIKKNHFAVLVEGQMDVLLSHQSGVTNTVASSGTALTINHLKILSRITSNLILALDQDDAGQQAASQIVQLAQSFDFNIKLIRFPRQIKDPGELIAQQPRLWRNALKQALYFIEWRLKNELDRLNHPPSLADKKNILRAILPQLKLINDPIELNHWTKMLSRHLDIDEKSILAALEKTQPQFLSATEHQPAKQSRPPSAQELLAAIFFHYPESQKKHPTLYKRLAKTYNKKELRVFQLALEKTYPGFSAEDFIREADRLAQRLKQQEREQMKQSFAQQIAQAEEAGDRRKVKQLLKQLQAKI